LPQAQSHPAARKEYPSRFARRATRIITALEGEPVSIRRLIVVLAAAAMLLAPSATLAAPPQKAPKAPQATSYPDCNLPDSNAESLVILANYYPGYWWDHTHLTIAVQAHPGVSEAHLAAVHEAIATWSAVLNDCFNGLITLTDIGNKRKGADIVVHYNPTAGGAVFGGYAICGANHCPNIIVRSDLPPSFGADQYSPEYLGWVTLHEVGHALGLGHATNLLESTDLMGYGWPDLGDPVLSQCDVEALAFVFAWAINGTEPTEPVAGPFECD
jgi:hypothetical protein